MTATMSSSSKYPAQEHIKKFVKALLGEVNKAAEVKEGKKTKVCFVDAEYSREWKLMIFLCYGLIYNTTACRSPPGTTFYLQG